MPDSERLFTLALASWSGLGELFDPLENSPNLYTLIGDLETYEYPGSECQRRLDIHQVVYQILYLEDDNYDQQQFNLLLEEIGSGIPSSST